ncbi:MAG: hypothetical protein CML12_03300 [Puniceicoccaceae bacterium]|nr:hypothetical protein [Puniceicoccaceae bacterium]RCL30034.1 MAG: hypothetical protein DBX03_02980 [Puniceicoccaceae bacterium]|tara:strand:- start:126 stop:1055 length:930 start_codon:yes stop_codon:yes gene_type:complete
MEMLFIPFSFEWIQFQGTMVFWLSLLLILAVFCFLIHKRYPLPILRILFHWLRWLAFACCFSWILKSGFGSLRPDWLHFITGLALWFIIETLIYRISIQLLNHSEMNLFPQFSSDHAGNLWPIQARAMEVKKILSELGFRSIGNVKAQIHDHLTVRQALFLNTTQTVRLSVLFIPNTNNRVQLYFSFYSLSQSNKQYITDNQNMPYGGYYPDHWSVQRYPLCHSLKTLHKQHLRRMDQSDQDWVCLEEQNTVVFSLNQNQRELELKNREMGFLLDSSRKEGKQISANGCFRIWTEMWLLAYFGRTIPAR